MRFFYSWAARGLSCLVYCKGRHSLRQGAPIKLTVGVDGISSLKKVYDVLDGVRRLVLPASAEGEGEAGEMILENAVVRRRGAQDWHIVFHAHGGPETLTYAFAEAASRHPELSATTIAFEEGRSVTVSRHIPGRSAPVSTDRYPLEMYGTLEEEFRFLPTDAEALLILPNELETVTLDLLQQRFRG